MHQGSRITAVGHYQPPDPHQRGPGEQGRLRRGGARETHDRTTRERPPSATAPAVARRRARLPCPAGRPGRPLQVQTGRRGGPAAGDRTRGGRRARRLARRAAAAKTTSRLNPRTALPRRRHRRRPHGRRPPVTNAELEILGHINQPMDVREGPVAVSRAGAVQWPPSCAPPGSREGLRRGRHRRPGAGPASRGRAGGPADHAEAGTASRYGRRSAKELGCPVMVDNDVNLMALGERARGRRPHPARLPRRQDRYRYRLPASPPPTSPRSSCTGQPARSSNPSPRRSAPTTPWSPGRRGCPGNPPQRRGIPARAATAGREQGESTDRRPGAALGNGGNLAHAGQVAAAPAGPGPPM
ncbi:hypothetical protein STENM327S_08022 [Streptomyces tendae]